MSENESDIKKHLIEYTSENLQLLGITFQNGYFVAIYEKKNMKLGTTALSLPVTTNTESKHTISVNEKIPFNRKGITTATVIGSRNEIITKALAEKITLSTNGLVYLSVNFQEDNKEFFNEAMKLVEKFIEKIT